MWQARQAQFAAPHPSSQQGRHKSSLAALRKARYYWNKFSSTADPKNQHLKLSANAASVWPASCARAACACRARLWQAATASAPLHPAQVCDAVANAQTWRAGAVSVLLALLHRAQGLHSDAAIAEAPAAHRCGSRRGFSSAGLATTTWCTNRFPPSTYQGASKSQSSSMWLSCAGHPSDGFTQLPGHHGHAEQRGVAHMPGD